MRDVEVASALANSSWERMAKAAEDHRRAVAEYVSAELEVFLVPSMPAEVRHLCATVALDRAERRLKMG